MATLIEARTGLEVSPINRPPKKDVISGVAAILIFLICASQGVKRMNALLQNKNLCMLCTWGVILVYFSSVLGPMQSIIRKMIMLEDSSKLVFFHGSGWQRRAEGFTVVFLGLLLAFGTHLLVTVPSWKTHMIVMPVLFVSFWASQEVVVLDNWEPEPGRQVTFFGFPVAFFEYRTGLNLLLISKKEVIMGAVIILIWAPRLIEITKTLLQERWKPLLRRLQERWKRMKKMMNIVSQKIKLWLKRIKTFLLKNYNSFQKWMEKILQKWTKTLLQTKILQKWWVQFLLSLLLLALVCALVCTFIISGIMNRKMPMFFKDKKDSGKFVLSYHGYGVQVGAEGLAVGFLYGLLLVFATHVLDTVRRGL